MNKRLSKADLEGDCVYEVINILLLSWNYKIIPLEGVLKF